MNFKNHIAKYVTGNLRTDQLPEIAIIGMEEGLNSPSLYILAGLEKNESPFQVEHYFKLALDELHIILPDKRTAALEYALAIAEHVINGKIPLMTGLLEIRYEAIDSYNFYEESKKLLFDSIGFERINGLFEAHFDLSDAFHQMHKDKTNEQLIIETEADLLIELKKWIERFK